MSRSYLVDRSIGVIRVHPFVNFGLLWMELRCDLILTQKVLSIGRIFGQLIKEVLVNDELLNIMDAAAF